MISTALSWAAFLAAAGVLAAAVWVRLIDPPRGEWRPRVVGTVVEPFRGRDTLRAVEEVTHPALLFFWGSQCQFCGPAGESLRAYVEEGGTGALPVFAITRDTLVSLDQMRKFGPRIRTLRLDGGVPSLGFVTDIPMLIRTSADGRVVSAYVGNPTDAVLRQMVPPREAGS